MGMNWERSEKPGSLSSQGHQKLHISLEELGYGETYFLCQLSLCAFSTTEIKHIGTILRKPIFLKCSRWP